MASLSEWQLRGVRPRLFDMASSTSRKTFVYFIQQGEMGPIKIGYSFDPAARLASLQTAHHEPLRMLFFERGGREEESALHTRFENIRISGEWFEPSLELLSYIKTWRMVDAHDDPRLESQWSLM